MEETKKYHFIPDKGWTRMSGRWIITLNPKVLQALGWSINEKFDIYIGDDEIILKKNGNRKM